jgi:hypothetical protein
VGMTVRTAARGCQRRDHHGPAPIQLCYMMDVGGGPGERDNGERGGAG